MKNQKYPKDILDYLARINDKRPKTVIRHLLKFGSISTEELKSKYGYEHPPRAIRDVREAGIPLEKISVKNSEGKTIAGYKFGDLTNIRRDMAAGRIPFPKEFKEILLERYGNKCAICSGKFEDRNLQIDHRIPYEIVGDSKVTKLLPRAYMLLCNSCNRAKSWSCEHCLNWKNEKMPKICSGCYWSYPHKYTRIALRNIRRMEILWDESDLEVYNSLIRRSKELKIKPPNYVKNIVRAAIR